MVSPDCSCGSQGRSCCDPARIGEPRVSYKYVSILPNPFSIFKQKPFSSKASSNDYPSHHKTHPAIFGPYMDNRTNYTVITHGKCLLCASQPECPSTDGDVNRAAAATLTHFNVAPTRICHQCHPQYIQRVYGCSAHRGELDIYGRCYYCEVEKQTGQAIPPRDIRTTYGYPGDDAM